LSSGTDVGIAQLQQRIFTEHLPFTFSDPNGATDIVSMQMDITAQLSATYACYFYYSRASNALYLANDAGAWQGR
jgi:hypothetical protein